MVERRPHARVLELCKAYLRRFPKPGLAAGLARFEEQLFTMPDRSAAVSILLEGHAPLVYLDIGARNGIPGYLARYGAQMQFYLVEPEPEEAARLREQGIRVIDRLISDRPGTAVLNVTRKPGGSSMLRPNLELLRYFARDVSNFDVVRTVDLPSTTIDEICREQGVRFDVIKADTQGSEWQILQGIGDHWPCAFALETSYMQYYCDQGTIFDIGSLLHRKGYVPWQLPHVTRIARGMLLHGDAFFMPDWSRPAGRTLILRDELKYAAVMMMFGLADVLEFVLAELPFAQRERIARALRS